jgi:hypothetical protein
MNITENDPRIISELLSSKKSVFRFPFDCVRRSFLKESESEDGEPEIGKQVNKLVQFLFSHTDSLERCAETASKIVCQVELWNYLRLRTPE